MTRLDPVQWLKNYCLIDYSVLDNLGAIAALSVEGDRILFLFGGYCGLPVRKWRRAGTKTFGWDGSGPRPRLWPLPAPRLSDIVVLVEGELDLIALAGVGFQPGVELFSVTDGPATRLLRGTGEELARRGAQVAVILPDADDPGLEAAEQWRADLAPLPAVVLHPAMVYDVLRGEKDPRDARRSADDPQAFAQKLRELITWAAELAPKPADEEIVPLTRVQPWQPPVLWWVIRRQVVHLLAGIPSAGKSTFALHLAVSLAAGLPFLGQPVPRTRVLYLSSENLKGTIADRVVAAFGELPGDLYVGGVRNLAKEDGLRGLIDEARALQVGLVILDAWPDFVPGRREVDNLEAAERSAGSGSWPKRRGPRSWA